MREAERVYAGKFQSQTHPMSTTSLLPRRSLRHRFASGRT